MRTLLKFIYVVIVVGAIILLPKFYKNYRLSEMLSSDYEPRYTINSLYKSKEISYRLLKEEDKSFYDTIIKCLIDYCDSTSINLTDYENIIDSSTKDTVNRIYASIVEDHPELFYVGTIGSHDSGGKIYIEPLYIMDKNEYYNNIPILQNQINYVKEQTNNLSEYEKILYVYNYIGSKNRYGNKEDWVAQTAYSALADGVNPVCAGYARASQILLSNVGIKSLIMTGELKTNLFFGGSHEWNVVKIGHDFYNFDVTQSSVLKNGVSYIGFLPKNKSQFNPISNKNYPFVFNQKYNYYNVNNLKYRYNDSTRRILEEKLSTSSSVEFEATNYAVPLREIANDFPGYSVGRVHKVVIIEKN